MIEDEVILENACFEFSQDANCLSDKEDMESITIVCEDSLGVDRGEGCFFILKTEGWSVNGVEDLEKLFNRIRKSILK